MLLNDFCSGLYPQNIIGSGSVRVHLHKILKVQVHRFEILKVRARFRFNDLKFKRFRFGSGSQEKSGFYRFAVQVRVRVRFPGLRIIFKSGLQYISARKPLQQSLTMDQ